ncbi:MAG TPA: transglycosylase domain-containing protein, partial [Paracoccaceae bacterium]|nr:transglycosylase domain-containing protein [Paracoccaceae bacterium]
MATKKKTSPPRRNFVSRAFRWIIHLLFRSLWWVGLRAAFVGAIVVGGFVAYYYATLPPMEELLDGRERGSVTLLDRSGEVFAWRGEQFDGSLRATTVTPHLKNAIIATEDKRFYSHFGISPRG